MNESIRPGLPVQVKGSREVGSSPYRHVGTVDHLEGERYIKLTKHDSSDGEHHWIPASWVERVDENGVYLRVSEDEFNAERFDSNPSEGFEEEERRAV